MGSGWDRGIHSTRGVRTCISSAYQHTFGLFDPDAGCEPRSRPYRLAVALLEPSSPANSIESSVIPRAIETSGVECIHVPAHFPSTSTRGDASYLPECYRSRCTRNFFRPHTGLHGRTMLDPAHDKRVRTAAMMEPALDNSPKYFLPP